MAVLIRTARAFSETLNRMPFEKINPDVDGTKVLLTFLSDRPTEEASAALLDYVKAPEKLVVEGQTVYLHCPNGYAKSKLSNSFIENRLNTSSTIRNLETVTKLCELANG